MEKTSKKIIFAENMVTVNFLMHISIPYYSYNKPEGIRANRRNSLKNHSNPNIPIQHEECGKRNGIRFPNETASMKRRILRVLCKIQYQ